MITLKFSMARPVPPGETRPPLELRATQVPRVGDHVFFDADATAEWTVQRISWDYGPGVEPGTVAYVVLR